MKTPAIGIDLGTTNSCVGIFQNGKVEIIADDQGRRTTTSNVSFTKYKRLIGIPVQDQEIINTSNTIFDAKRLIGRKFSDDTVQADMKRWPFRVIDDKTKPKIRVKIDDKIKTYCPEEISSMVLMKMKEIAEAYLGETVENAVITVPSYFNGFQRQATKDAATIAGLKVLRIINEPSAAAIAYGVKNNISGERNVLIFDLGGGNFNVSIVTLQNGLFEVKSSAGDIHLGGEDFDYRMVNHFVEEFKHIHKKDISRNKKALRCLKIACEQAKITLSSSTQAIIKIDSLYEGIDFYTSINRTCFEELNVDLFKRTLKLVKKSIRDAKMDKENIDEVVLVGGSSRIPKIQKQLQNFFDGKELNTSINPDEAVAYGAALQAAALNGDKSDEIKDLLLVEITPESLGVLVKDDLMSVVIKRNTTIPARETKYFTILEDNQTSVSVEIFEGEFEETKYNRFLGELEINGIPPALARVPEIEVTFQIDANGILIVSAVEKTTRTANQITISYSVNGLSGDEIRTMIKEAQEYKIEEEKRRISLDAKYSLESYCINTKNMILKKFDETIRWLDSNEAAEKDEYERKQKELENIFNFFKLAEELNKI